MVAKDGCANLKMKPQKLAIGDHDGQDGQDEAIEASCNATTWQYWMGNELNLDAARLIITTVIRKQNIHNL